MERIPSEVDDRMRLIILAHLHLGNKTPRQISDFLNVEYLAVVHQQREYKKAIDKKQLDRLTKMTPDSFDILVQAAAMQESGMDVESRELVTEAALIGEIDQLGANVKKLTVVEDEFQSAAIVLAQRIKQIAATSTASDSMLSLAEALMKLQTAFFGNKHKVDTNTNSGFEKFLTD